MLVIRLHGRCFECWGAQNPLELKQSNRIKDIGLVTGSSDLFVRKHCILTAPVSTTSHVTRTSSFWWLVKHKGIRYMHVLYTLISYLPPVSLTRNRCTNHVHKACQPGPTQGYLKSVVSGAT